MLPFELVAQDGREVVSLTDDTEIDADTARLIEAPRRVVQVKRRGRSALT